MSSGDMATVKRLAAHRARPRRKGDTETKQDRESSMNLKSELLSSVTQSSAIPAGKSLNDKQFLKVQLFARTFVNFSDLPAC